jgi:transcription termination factor Rho
MDNNYADIIKNNSNYKEQRASKYKADSKERLSKILKKKIETTMIGALSSIEDHFGFLWASNSDSAPTEEQVTMRDLYQQIRSEILDKGNSQARNIDAELSQYEVEWTKYSIAIPVVAKEN